VLIENEIKLDYKDVLFKPKRSTLTSRQQVDLFRTIEFRNAKGCDRRFYGIPIIASNMDGVGTFEMATELRKSGLMTCLVKTYSQSELVEYFDSDSESVSNYTIMSIGATKEDFKKIKNVYELTDGKVKYLCVDVANGYTEFFSQFIYSLRIQFPELIIMAGNVVTGDMTQELILNGADVVKCGIGPGSVCTTRIQTGVGFPQLSATIECADAAHGLGASIIADGGCTTPGCVSKALGGGADFVMLGGMFAGHDEGGGKVTEKEYITSQVCNDSNKSQLFNSGSEAHRKTRIHKTMQFYGMSSTLANEKHFGGLKDYRASEGKEVEINYKGNIKNTLQDLLGSIRSTCTYIGAKRLKDIPKCTTFVRCSDTHNRVYE
jgi:GMP reductase